VKEKLIVILGPTAVGKTALSIQLAQKLQTQIISGDSMLVYKGMDIGTAKPDVNEMAGIKHHMIDILPPGADFSVTRFKSLAAECINKINEEHKIPILAGGTGLYIKSLVEDYCFNKAPGDEAYRHSLELLAEQKGKQYVHALLEKIDPIAAERLHVNDFRRVIRALEVYHVGGETISQEKQAVAGELAYDVYAIGLNRDRAHLYERINMRVEKMFEAGLIAEVEALLQTGLDKRSQAMQGIGYKEVAAYLAGEISLLEAKELIQKSTRHFAKRQLTWYRKMPYIHWYDVGQMSEEELLQTVYKDVAGNFAIK
jgi:tRNA dimethylallyltransferase